MISPNTYVVIEVELFTFELVATMIEIRTIRTNAVISGTSSTKHPPIPLRLSLSPITLKRITFKHLKPTKMLK